VEAVFRQILVLAADVEDGEQPINDNCKPKDRRIHVGKIIRGKDGHTGDIWVYCVPTMTGFPEEWAACFQDEADSASW
jgi:hypothetical protein